MPIAVNEQSDDIKLLAQEWPQLEALQSGTRAMRAGKSAFMPQWPGELDEAYGARLATATLFPAYQRTVGVMAGKPFSKSLSLTGADQSIEKWAENIDLQGVNLHSFASDLFRQSVGYGLGGILVEHPVSTGAGRTTAQVEASGVRPYWVAIKHKQILGWQMGTYKGAPALSQLRLLESVEVQDGPWGTKHVEQVRVLYQGGWETYQQSPNKSWELVGSGRTTLDRIPFVPTYGRRLSYMMGEAPLLDLAYLNVKHWQSQSDQDTILHVARVPILARTGVDAGLDGKLPALSVGSGTVVDLPREGTLEYVEHTGASIEAGRLSLQDLEEQMIQTGAELLVKAAGQRTATESSNDAEANKSELQRMAEGFEDSLDMALEFTAEYRHLNKAGSVQLFSDYGAATLSDASAQLVLSLQQGGLISKVRAIEELKRRGVLSAEVDADDEIAKAQEDGPALGTLGVGDGNDQ
ncbi:DUF4055 domain-containing protein [Stenotrophomonas sp.]|uniref:DUF4055 domain-containing protein n=1 Tax=Stenotrophomonas sp. TaxID=69392 RepID=UPI0028A9AEC3|nr:DUF4055 domain-containing protein [Stenotrophomonas sp.]